MWYSERLCNLRDGAGVETALHVSPPVGLTLKFGEERDAGDDTERDRDAQAENHPGKAPHGLQDTPPMRLHGMRRMALTGAVGIPHAADPRQARNLYHQ